MLKTIYKENKRKNDVLNFNIKQDYSINIKYKF